jgi:3-deoxy-D-manno-octulosonic-acid transferase
MRDVLARFTQCNMQTEHDAERLLALGAPPARVAVAGNIKFDAVRLVDTPAPDAALRDELGLPADVPVFLAAALDKQGDEDALMIDVLEQVRAQTPAAALIIVPRHPERGAEIARLVAQRGYVPRQRSQQARFTEPQREIYIGDTIGELQRFYTIAHAVFVGKSLFAPGGGQNMIEPIALGVPTVYGPYTANFRGVADVLLEHGGARLVRSAGELVTAITELWHDPAAACAMVQRGQAFIRSQQGATQRNVASVLAALNDEH